MVATRRALFIVAGLALLAMLALPALLSFSVEIASFADLFLLAAVLVLFLPYAHFRKLTGMVPALESMAVGLALTPAVIVFSYAAMRLNLPLADAHLIRADEAMGFDWPAFIHWLDGSEFLVDLLKYSYMVFGPELFLLPALLCAVGLPLRAYQVTLGWLLLGILASMITIFFPAVATYEAHGVTQADLANINVWLGTSFLESFHAVRSQSDFTLSVDNVSGIISFPSIHAGAGVLCIWATWPSRLLRYPFLLINGLMIVSALPYGAHYLVDLVVGSILAVVVIAVMERIASRPARAKADLPELRPAIELAP